MKLYYSPASPFARKVLVVAHETGLTAKIEVVGATAHPIDRNRTLISDNPLGQIPTLITDDGQSLYDSRVICEYLDGLGNGKAFPASGAARWSALTLQAAADGVMGASLLVRYEDTARPENLRSDAWKGGQLDKITTTFALFETEADNWGDRYDIGTVTVGCALGYLDLRFASMDWRTPHPKLSAWFKKFSERPSMLATVPKA